MEFKNKGKQGFELKFSLIWSDKKILDIKMTVSWNVVYASKNNFKKTIYAIFNSRFRMLYNVKKVEECDVKQRRYELWTDYTAQNIP